MALSGHALRLSKQPEAFNRLTGLSPAKFSRLLKDIAPIWEASEQKRLGSRKRARAIGAGTPYKLPLCDRLLMLLIYYRTYVTYAFLGFMFGLDDSNVSRIIGRLKPCLAKHFRIPERRIMPKEDTYALFLTPLSSPSSGPRKKRQEKVATLEKRSGTR